MALVALAALAAIACAGPSTRTTLVDSRDTDDPRSLDPALSTDVETGRAVAYIFDGLVGFDPEARVQPGLAARWEISPDGLRYTFHLRQGVVFQDGTPFSSRNVVSSWERLLNPATKSGRADLLYPIQGARKFARGSATRIAGLAAPNDTTVIVTLTQPLAVFIKLLAMPAAAIVPDHVPSDFGEHPVGTGPWKLVEWAHDDYLLFARNARYWAGPPAAESLRARIIADPSTAVAEFESGNVDVLRVPEGEAREWLDDESRAPELRSVPALELVYVAINTTRGPLSDVRVRQALNYAVDVNRIIDRLVSGRGTRAAGVIPPALDGYDSTRRGYPYDPARARQLLAEAGHPNGIDVALWCSTDPFFERIAETLQAYLDAVGIRTTIVQREAATARASARQGRTDLILKDWFADYPDAENFLYPLLHSANRGAGGNVSFFSDAAFDRTVDSARSTLDAGRRRRLYTRADSMAEAAAPMLFLYFYNELYALQPWLHGFVPPVIFNGQRWIGASIVRTP